MRRHKTMHLRCFQVDDPILLVPVGPVECTAPTIYYVFDVLWHNSADLTGTPILERRSVLEHIIKPTPGIQLGQYIEAEGKALFELTKEKGMEGIIAKRKDSIYRPGKRTSD
jgi:ATP-dependent DNA ligase